MFQFVKSPYLTAALGAAVDGPFLVVPVLNSVVVAEGRPPQLIGQLFVLFSLKGGERSSVSNLIPSRSGSH